MSSGGTSGSQNIELHAWDGEWYRRAYFDNGEPLGSQTNSECQKGYIPGVRENGGQYTHGAIWTAMAFALMGESDRAWELFALLNPIHHGHPNKSRPTK